MLDTDTPISTDQTDTSTAPGAPARPARKRAPRSAATKAAVTAPDPSEPDAARAAPPAKAVRKTAKKAAKKPAKAAQATEPTADHDSASAAAVGTESGTTPAARKAAKKPGAKSTAKTAQRRSKASDESAGAGRGEAGDASSAAGAPAMAAPSVLFVAPDVTAAKRTRRVAKAPAGPPPEIEPQPGAVDLVVAEDAEDSTAEPEDVKEAAVEEAQGARRRRRRGRRGRGGGRSGEAGTDAGEDEGEQHQAEAAETDEPSDEDGAEPGGDGADSATGTRRRRRRRRGANGGESGETTEDDPPNTVTHVREARKRADAGDDGVRGVKGSTRLEAKRQRRRDGRDTGRRRAPILTEAEFLARRESVERVMAVRQNGDRTQIAVLEDDILVEHFVTRASATSYVGNVYLGRVQNVLPSMEAAFVDIGKGRNGVIYAGEVNWDAAGLAGKSRAIESALKSGDSVLVQVTKDPIGHKGARLTSQISLPGRFLVYVPGGGMTGISRKLPDAERRRLKAILKKVVPEDAGVIIRTAAEGASEAELGHDVERLKAQWEAIEKKAKKTKAAPTLLHGEPDLAIRVVRDVFNEDFKRVMVQGERAWETVSEYVADVAPDLTERVSQHTGESDLFHDLRVDEQLLKALDRKVWLPSGGSLVIDRTEAMTVIDVNTGKFVGSGGNLEQTVTRNNLEAAEEIVRQLRLRDVGGIVVIDFIDMVLESNRDLVLRRLTECLGRDRTKHQVAEVTSLGLVQMTRKRVGEGLLEAFSEPCEHCHGRGVILHLDGHTERGDKGEHAEPPEAPAVRERRLAAMAAIHRAAHPELDSSIAADAPVELTEADLTVAGIAKLDDEPDQPDLAHGGDEPVPVETPEAAELARLAELSDTVEFADPVDLADPVELADTGELADTAELAESPPVEELPAAEHADAPAEIGTQIDATEVGADHEPVAAARPRRRRAASRPAGPPVGTAEGVLPPPERVP